MNLEIERVPIEDKSVLRNLLELYIYDFTEFGPYDVDAHGLFGYKYLDLYWTEEGRYPFIYRVDGKIAGFALVRREFREDLEEYCYSIAEFFVMKRYRGSGIGRDVAFYLFQQFPGLWEVDEMESNKPAQAFWRKVINEFTKGAFEETRKEGWNGPVQRFRSGLHL